VQAGDWGSIDVRLVAGAEAVRLRSQGPI
jgi:hypothetical protein